MRKLLSATLLLALMLGLGINSSFAQDAKLRKAVPGLHKAKMMTKHIQGIQPDGQKKVVAVKKAPTTITSNVAITPKSNARKAKKVHGGIRTKTILSAPVQKNKLRVKEGSLENSSKSTAKKAKSLKKINSLKSFKAANGVGFKRPDRK